MTLELHLARFSVKHTASLSPGAHQGHILPIFQNLTLVSHRGHPKGSAKQSGLLNSFQEETFTVKQRGALEVKYRYMFLSFEDLSTVQAITFLN